MKKRLVWILTLGAALALLLMGTAFAADDVRIGMELSSSEFTSPEKIHVIISVINTGSEDLPGPVRLYDPDGKQIMEFGEPVLGVGENKSWMGEWEVTQDQLEAGRITFRARFSVYTGDTDAQGHRVIVKKRRDFSRKITYNPPLAVRRTIVPEAAREGQAVTVTYEAANNGTEDITNVRIRENGDISLREGEIALLRPGETETVTFETAMGSADLTSEADITYDTEGTVLARKIANAVIRFDPDAPDAAPAGIDLGAMTEEELADLISRAAEELRRRYGTKEPADGE